MNLQDVELNLDQIIPPDNSTPSLIENDENNCDDDEHIHQKYIEMLTHDYMNSQRAKKDKELRQKSRKMFSVLSNVMHRAHSDPLVNTSGVINIGLEPDTNRGRDSDLRTLQNANKLLESLIKDCRKLKIYRATLKKDLKAHKKSRKKARKKPACVTDPQVSANSPPSYHKKPSGDSQYLSGAYVPMSTSTNLDYFNGYATGTIQVSSSMSHNSLNHNVYNHSMYSSYS